MNLFYKKGRTANQKKVKSEPSKARSLLTVANRGGKRKRRQIKKSWPENLRGAKDGEPIDGLRRQTSWEK